MGKYALLICGSQTEAQGMRRKLARIGVMGEVTRPPRHSATESCGWAVRVLSAQADDAARKLSLEGMPPCKVQREGD